MKGSPAFTALGFAAIAIGVVLDLRIALRGDRDPVDLSEVRALVARESKPGDLVVHSPLFSVAELQPLGDMRASPALPPREIRENRRFWVIDLAPYPMHGFGGADAEHVLGGGVLVSVHEPAGGARVALFDLHDDLSRARMRIERPLGNVTSSCTEPRGEGGFQCPGEAEWLYLAQRSLVISGKNASCVWAHPINGGVIVIELPAMPAPPAGRVLSLSVSAGMADEAVKTTSDGAAVTTSVWQTSGPKGDLVLENRLGWATRDFAIAPDQPVELRIATPRDGRRHHCINARIEER